MDITTPSPKVSPIHRLASMIAVLSSNRTIADLMNDFLCIDADDRFCDADAKLGVAFFSALTDSRPDCIKLASGM